ncbi:E3 ubiquitin-protein ligase RFWD3-like protein [Drosera capensis]
MPRQLRHNRLQPPPNLYQDLEFVYDEEFDDEQFFAEQEALYADTHSSSGSESDNEEEEEEVDGDGEVEIIGSSSIPARVREEEEEERRRRASEATASGKEKENEGEGEGEGEWDREGVEGLVCPICMEAWSNEGEHNPSCLPCGHLYGMPCIKKWLRKQKSSGKCPQCNKKCTLKDVRRIYGSRVVVIDEQLNKRIRFLETKCDAFEKKEADLKNKKAEWHKKEAEWHRKEAEWRTREAGLCQQLDQLKEEARNMELVLANGKTKSPKHTTTGRDLHDRPDSAQTLGSSCESVSCGFLLQEELHVDDARLFDVNTFTKLVVIAQRQSGTGVTDKITKMSLVSPRCQESISLPSALKAVKDLHFSDNGKHVLTATLGKKLAILCTESNNMVLSYELPAAAWSCSWDLYRPFNAYAGLQNGMLLAFDTRQTGKPLESRKGMTCNPIHTIYPLRDAIPSSNAKAILTASAVGLCQWNMGATQEWPYLIPETENQGVCISLAYSPITDDIVSSYRPKVEAPRGTSATQPSQTLSPSMESSVPGTHVAIRRVGDRFVKSGSTYGTVPAIRLPKSVVFDTEDQHPLFASGDEATSSLFVQDLRSLEVCQRLHCRHPVHDLKSSRSMGMDLLSCLSGDHLRIFSQLHYCG